MTIREMMSFRVASSENLEDLWSVNTGVTRPATRERETRTPCLLRGFELAAYSGRDQAQMPVVQMYEVGSPGGTYAAQRSADHGVCQNGKADEVVGPVASLRTYSPAGQR
jgi:hypothetical protein